MPQQQQQAATAQLLQQYRQQQEDERAAIESIFESEAEFAKNSWKIWRPIDVVLHLKPAESGSRVGTTDGAYASADLHFACTDRYPDDSPRVDLLNVKGIPTGDQQALKQLVQMRVEELKGEPVILDVASVVRDFLADKRQLPTGSFHQGMLEKQRKEQSEMKRATETIVEREREEIETEKERIEEERRRQKEEAADEGRRRRESEAADAVGEGAGMPHRMIGAKKVFLVQEDYPQRRGLHPLCHEWYGVYEKESVLVSEWKLTHNLGRKGEKPMEVDKLKDRLSQLEKEADKVVELEEMDTALSRIAFVVTTTQALTPTNINIRIYVAQRIPRTARNLDNVLNTVKRDESALRRFTLQAVCGLRWLHDQSMVHGSLTSTAVFLCDQRNFLIADCVVPRLVQQVAESLKECTGVGRGGVEKGGERGEGDAREKVTKKMKDLFALGCLLDKLAQRTPESSSDSLAAHSNSDLADFIHLCQSAKTADELLDHPFLIQDIQPTGSTTSSVTAFSRASRLIKEFNIFKWLGKGGFGEVTLARNKLDGNDYAVKTIALNPGNESLNRRVTREAKIFSKLNHPNVVRYFSAWTEDMVPEERAGEGDGGERPKGARKHSMVRKASSLRGGDGDSLLPSRLKAIEARAVEMSEWSTSYRVPGEGESTCTTDDDDESTDAGGGGGKLPGRTLFSPKHQVDDSFDIIFEASGVGADDDDDEEEEGEGESVCDLDSTTQEESKMTKGEGGATTTGWTRNTESPPTRILYIQMEYCERGTLRHAIDRKLFVNDAKRIWRVFGEMLSGLQYIHKQDMIHRDIKPMNILLDSKEHVKIGDFGLATRQYFSKIAKKGGAEGSAGAGEQTGGERKQSSDLTMDIGTELYMAPELFPERSQNDAAAAAEAAPYTNKIDVFSAGIVLFEMFYRPLPPGMERISTLRALKANATVPSDFNGAFTTHHWTNARRLIESMLAVDPSARPTIDRILEDDRISFNDSEEEIFKKQLIKTVKGRSGRLFKYIMETLVKEEPTAAQAYCYDANICKEKFSMERESSMGVVISQLSQLLQLHAFKPLSSPLLRASMHAKKETSRTKPVLMVDQAGFPVNLPLDLRENFVRVVARNSVFRLKRYTIGRCFGYGELPGGVHPTERWECSVDAVGPVRSSLTLSLSILAVAVNVAAHLVPAHVRCVLRIGHVGLIRAALLHDGHGEEKHESLLHAIAMKRGHDVISKELQSTLCAPKATASQLRSELKSLLKARDDRVREGVREAIDEMEAVMEALRSADEGSPSRPDILLDPMLVARPAIFGDGLLFQLEVQPPSHKRPSILSQGGRYDRLLKKEQCSNDFVFDSPLALFGCSFSLDLLVNCGGGEFRPPSVVVCSYSEPLLHEKLQMASSLRKRGVVVDVLHGTVDNDDSMAEFCSKNAVSFVLSFLQRNEVLVKRLDVEESTKMSPSDAIDYVIPLASTRCLPPPAILSSSSATSFSDTTVLLPLTPTHLKEPARSMSMSNIAITYGVSERLAYNTKKRIETQLFHTLADSLTHFKPQTIISVVVVGVPFELVKNVAGMLTRSAVPSELTNLFDSLQKSHGKAKEDLESMYAALMPMFADKAHNSNPLVLFRHQDNLFRYIL